MRILLGFLLLTSLVFVSCGDDAACESSDWIGTYDLTSDAVCDLGDGTTVESDPVFVIEDGATAGTLMADGMEFSINEDDCTADVLFLTLSLDGDQLTTTVGPECSFEFQRR